VGIPYAINDGFVRKDGVALGLDGLAHGQYKRQDDGKDLTKKIPRYLPSALAGLFLPE
jgi:hypothetical protein